MDENCNRSGPSSTRRKSNNEEPVEHAVAVPNNEPLPSIFKLDADCFEEIFDYLSLKDLSSVGQTCTRMQKIAGYCFKQNYGAAKGSFHRNDRIFVNNVKVNFFVEFIHKVSFDDYSDLDYQNEANDEDIYINIEYDEPQNRINLLKKCDSIKTIEIIYHDITKERFERIKEILNKVECVKIHDHLYKGNLVDAVLSSCLNLKFLCMNGLRLYKKYQPQWLNRYNPMLEYFELRSIESEELPTLKTFFQLNTGIKRFAVNDIALWFNRQMFTSVGLEFDVLAIEHDDFNNKLPNLDSFYRLLNELYEENGFYKKLHIYCSRIFDQNMIDQLAKLNKLVKLRAKSDVWHLNLSALVNLEELCINKSYLISDLESLPITLINLRRIYFGDASSDDIFPFIRKAVKINKIKVRFLFDGIYFSQLTNILDLPALNKEREKLIDARKITIYVDEDVYLATKWAMKQTDYTLIEMKRFDSYDWQHEFDDYRFDF